MQFSYDHENIYAMKHYSVIAKANFTTKDSTMFINHVLVEEAYRGQGVAHQLMLEIIKYSENNNLLIKPICKYAQMFFKHNSKYSYLLND
ncbi:N-acetyltransferase [Apilactobacillus timberlakei]|uniref:GNAT family N-acetyltransferase n=1 Tax=Apilactobacillus timberlakei TaxID=2008380 RepID=UPI0011298C6C|nr:GNAT family N-acetyltransferase [Apilactobacillus timberlakei]TPR19647.1 N-acetyltransferase [Apilactobacillus timberlakei]TPR20624.1 N-acetyltransferase [Apilactobacillus timberlakei]TPR22667.1 N-acetyltransferase [Apilactobacillus timberlakei]TPR23185.1 N-acetyltransferase [Apilactobacillus timberlakei]